MTGPRWYHVALGLAAYPPTWPWLLGKAAVLVGGVAAFWWWRNR